MPLISIIIPLYNAETYLHQCLDSVLAQRFRDFELLLINDGSKDSTLDICRQYATKDERIRVFDKPNGGVSSTRNFGIEHAIGEWIMFIDGDDWIDDNLLDVGLPYLQDYDLINIGACIEHRNDGSIYMKQHIESKNINQYLIHLIRRKARLSIWGTFIRRSLFIDNNIRFDTTYNYAEDWLALLQLAAKCDKIKIINNAFVYHYNLFNQTSCSNTLTIHKLMNNIRLITESRTILKERLTRRLTHKINFTKLSLYNLMIGKYGNEELYNYLATTPHKIEFYTYWDVLVADFGFRKKHALFSFLRYAHSRGLTAKTRK